jgi:DNA-binding NarL/FixJ family response regulator
MAAIGQPRPTSRANVQPSEPPHSGMAADASWISQQLDAAELLLAEALAHARASERRCEQSLALLANLRQRVPAEGSQAEPAARFVADAVPLLDYLQAAPGGLATDFELPLGRLTARESQVLDLVARGHSNRDIAEALFLSPRTVERHIATIYNKIHVHDRAGATRYARGNHAR